MPSLSGGHVATRQPETRMMGQDSSIDALAASEVLCSKRGRDGDVAPEDDADRRERVRYAARGVNRAGRPPGPFAQKTGTFAQT